MNENLCSICETELKGLYCFNCGQKVTRKKASIFTLIFDFFANIFSVENSFLTTFIAVIKRPAFLVNNYYEGNKGVLITPGKFILFTSIFLAFRFLYFKQPYYEIVLDDKSGQEYFILGLMLTFPILSSIIVFVKKKKIIMRSIISIAYISSFVVIIMTLIELPFLLMKVELSIIYVLIAYLSIFVINCFVFNENKRWYVILLKSLLQLIILIIIVFITLTILSQIFPDYVHMGITPRALPSP